MNTTIILAAGKGRRMKSDVNKLLMSIAGKPVIEYTLDAFESCDEVHEIILVTSEDEYAYYNDLKGSSHYSKIKSIVIGGAERQDSVYNGLMKISGECEIVLIHDGARPFVTKDIITACIADAKLFGAASAGMPVKDTIKIVSAKGTVNYTPRRDNIWITQTPQSFQREVIMEAHDRAKEQCFSGTDDAVLAERAGYTVKMVEAGYENIKITTPEDILIAEAIINRRQTV
ncbi:MAG: 2-C-methyl-D-erythritol 4-phosphate cytidylyltransferase [Bacillota bacterium]